MRSGRAALWFAGALLLALWTVGAAGRTQSAAPTADAVLSELRSGNEHHALKRYDHPHQTEARQRELSSGQHPHAAILSCADSRVAPEIVFDQGLGDLFDVRVAGNIAGDTEVASLEYAAEHLNVPLIVVMGHQKCGAVTAAVEGGEASGHLSALVGPMEPAVKRAKTMTGDRIENAVKANVEMVVNQLRNSRPILSEFVHDQRLRIVGAVYSLDTGRVQWLADR